MASVYSKNLQIYNAEQFKTSIGSLDQPYLYFTFGRVTSWPDENNPTQANTSVSTFNQMWKNMVGAKLLQGNDVRLGIRRYDWISGESYFQYDDCTCSMDMNDATHKFYVVTDEWNVYKCISNNRGGLSTSKPTTIDVNLVEQTADNYIWKYMYTLTDEEKLRFVTPEYIPVKTLTEDDGSLQWQVQEAARIGSIEAVKVINGGSGYSAPVVVTITGDGSSANATATINATTSAIESISIVNNGGDYSYADVSITANTGSGAIARAIISPPGGHGSNPVEELGGSFAIVNARLRGSETDVLDVDNDIRQIAIIKNPVLLDSDGEIASGSVYSQATTVFLAPVGGNYIEDEIVFQGVDPATASFKGTVLSWNSTLNRLRLIDVSGTLSSGPLTGDTSKTSRIYNGNNIDKAFEPYSGSLLYLNNIPPIQRAEDQTEDFKIVFSF
jgi:hypothetical protein